MAFLNWDLEYTYLVQQRTERPKTGGCCANCSNSNCFPAAITRRSCVPSRLSRKELHKYSLGFIEDRCRRSANGCLSGTLRRSLRDGLDQYSILSTGENRGPNKIRAHSQEVLRLGFVWVQSENIQMDILSYQDQSTFEAPNQELMHIGKERAARWLYCASA
jgi:hypothetical protein